MKDFERNHIVNLPDISFVQFCVQEYKINRGIYNTIDSWFFNKGIVGIIQRRNTILSFLIYINKLKSTKNKKIRFGNGGLSLHLTDFSQLNNLAHKNIS